MSNNVIQFLNVLFPDLNGGYIELRSFYRKTEPRAKFYSSKNDVLAEWSAIEGDAKTRDIYFGVCPRSIKEGNKKAVKFVFCLWADLDGKDFARGKDEALKRVREFHFIPSIIVDSGHGYHCYWLLKEGVLIETQQDVERVEASLKALACALNADVSCAELARVLRLPGTFNYKEVPVCSISIVELDQCRQYNLSDFDFLLLEPESVSVKLKGNPPGWIADALLKMKEGNRNQTFARIIGRLHKDGYTEADILALLKPLSEGCGFSYEELIQEINGICKRYPCGADDIIKHVSNAEHDVVEDVDINLNSLFPSVSFPVGVFPLDLQRFISKCSAAFCVSPNVVASMMLTIISGSLGNTIRIQVRDGWDTAPFLWLNVIGRSGSGKSPCLNALLSPVRKKASFIYQRYLKEKGEYDCLVADKKNKNKNKKEEPVYERIFLTDTTFEGLVNAMRSSPRGFPVVYDELSGFIKSHNQYKRGVGSDTAKYLEIWDCQPISVERKGAPPLYVPITGCAVLGGTQPLILHKVFEDSSFVNGLFPRFLQVMMSDKPLVIGKDRLFHSDKSVWQEYIDKCYEQKVQIVHDVYTPIHFYFSQEAEDLFIIYQNQLNEIGMVLPDMVQVFLPKLIGFAARIAGLIHFVRNGYIETKISKETVQDSLDVINFFCRAGH
jgi:hypothetical protein